MPGAPDDRTVAALTSRFRRRARWLLSRVPVFLVRRFVLSRRSTLRWMGIRLVVEPGVFHPRVFLSTAVLARALRSRTLRGLRVLDMGTGSGALGILAALHGARVVAVDIDPRAAACASANAERNGRTPAVSVVCGDLCSMFRAETHFDLILWNPPFHAADPGAHRPSYWFGGEGHDVLRRFAGEITRHLLPGGSLLLLLSSDMDEVGVLGFFRSAGLHTREVGSRRGIFERLTVYELRG